MADYKIKKYLSVQDQVAFVHDAVAIATVDGEYEPALADFAMKYCFVKYFTDVVIPDDQDEANKMFYESDIIKEIDKTCDFSTMHYLYVAIDKTVEQYNEVQKLAMSMAKPDPMDRIADVIENFFASMEKSLSNTDKGVLDSVLKKLNGISQDQIIKAVVKNNKAPKQSKSKLKVPNNDVLDVK